MRPIHVNVGAQARAAENLRRAEPRPQVQGASPDCINHFPADRQGAPQRVVPPVPKLSLKPKRDSTLRSFGKYEVRRQLGAGGFGRVFHVLDSETNAEFALKEIDMRKCGKRYAAREITVLSSLRHEHIVRYHSHEVHGNYLWLVMELVKGESLESRITRTSPIGEDSAKKIVRQIVSALVYCHRSGVVHRDIKPANVVISATGVVKVVDFGIGKALSNDEQVMTYCGTPSYMAPEIEAAHGERQYDGRASDVWSLGLLLYRLLTGNHPHRQTLRQMRACLDERVRGGTLTQEAVDLVKSMLKVEPDLRISCADVLSSAWFVESPMTVQPVRPVRPLPLTQLFAACRHGSLDKLLGVLAAAGHPSGASRSGIVESLNVRDCHGNTPLMLATQNNQKRICRFLLDLPVDMNAQNHMGNTALHFACTYRYEGVVAELVGRGADSTLCNNYGKTCRQGLH